MSRLRVALIANDWKPAPDWVGSKLSEAGVVLCERDCGGENDVLEVAADADVVWLMGGSCLLTESLLRRLTRCRVVLRTGTGTDNVPVDEATRLGILVANTPEAAMHQVAEHALGLLLAVVRQIAAQDRLVRQGVWDRMRAWPNWTFVGRTLGLVGFGRIAQLVARKSRGLEMRVIACDPQVSAAEMNELGVEKVHLEALLRRSDFVSLHVPLLESTRSMIGARELQWMKPSAVLINTSRGAVVDEGALVAALAEGGIAAAGLDVLEMEPPAADHPLLTLDNVVLTPHIAGYSDVFHEQFWEHSVRTLLEMAEGRSPLWCVNNPPAPRLPTGSTHQQQESERQARA
jgi:D-3-phosphoglycerate dehydrogenase